MTNSNSYMDKLFEKAREEQPIASFEEIKLRFSNTIDSGYSGAHSISFSKFYISIIILSCFTVLTTIAIVYININKSLIDDISETYDYIPTKIEFRSTDFQSTDFQKEAEESLSSKNGQKILPSSTSFLGTIQEVKEKEPDSSNFTREPILVRNSELIVIPRLKKNAHSLKALTLPAVKKRPIDLSEPKKIEGIAIEFTINDRTSTQKLASIAYQAKQAEIEYTYVVDLQKKLIREFNVDMSIPGTDLASTIQVSLPKKGRFEIKFGWYVDAEGRVIKLTDNIIIEKAQSKHPLSITLARNFCQIYLDEGIRYMEQHFDSLIKEAKLKGPKENILNAAGYIFLKQHAYTEAIEIFKLNTRLFPKKANLWDSLGEGLYENGEKESALKAFQKALSINPRFSSSKRWIEKIITEQ